MRVAVLGLGYVGAVSLGCLARDGHFVTGVDLDALKLEMIRNGKSPIIEAGMSELISEAARSGRVKTTADVAEAITATDVSFVCVGTPDLPNGSQNLSAVERVSEQVGRALKDHNRYHLVVIRSTVAPGTVEGVIAPIIEGYSGKPAGRDYDVCFQPEFLREGSSIRDYDNPPYTVVGTDSERAAALLRELFGHLEAAFLTTSIRSAEFLKYACNMFHAVKITFANEVGRLAQSMGADSHAVMNLLCRDRNLNISTAYLKPGFAFGGSCLPKDLQAILHKARNNDVSTPMLSAVLPSNEHHVVRAIDLVLQSGKKKIGLIGLSFKSGTDDLRNSPLVMMAERFIGKGLDLQIYDPQVHLSRLIGANRRYIEEVIPHISSLLVDDCTALVRRSEGLVVGLGSEEVVQALSVETRDDHFILDLVNLPARDKLAGEYQGICW